MAIEREAGDSAVGDNGEGDNDGPVDLKRTDVTTTIVMDSTTCSRRLWNGVMGVLPRVEKFRA